MNGLARPSRNHQLFSPFTLLQSDTLVHSYDLLNFLQLPLISLIDKPIFLALVFKVL